jgi:HAD superfamily hydrolase (TIGR01509 family)
VTAPLPSAVLWDMDGTLVDSEPYWIEAETDLIHSFGGDWSHEEAMQLVGSGLWHSARIIQAKGVTLSEDEIIDRLTDRVIERLTERVPWRPGARQLLTAVREAGIPTALVTMSISRMAHHVADRVGFDAFDAVVAGDEVTHAKPHPEPYLRGAQLLGVDIARAVAIEDSSTGVASALASGATVIGVPFLLDLNDSGAHALWDTLDGRGVDDLARLVGAAETR